MTNDPVATARGSDTLELHPKEKRAKLQSFARLFHVIDAIAVRLSRRQRKPPATQTALVTRSAPNPESSWSGFFQPRLGCGRRLRTPQHRSAIDRARHRTRQWRIQLRRRSPRNLCSSPLTQPLWQQAARWLLAPPSKSRARRNIAFLVFSFLISPCPDFESRPFSFTRTIRKETPPV